MLPKVQTADQVVALDLLLTQIEKTVGLEVGRIGIEAQIENALGLINVDAIATAQPARRDDHLRARGLHGVDQHEEPGRRRAAAGVRRRRRLPLHPDADPDGGPRPRQAGDRRALPPDPRRRRLQAGRRPQRRARVRRQVGAPPRPDRCRQRGLLAAAGGLRPRREHPRRVRALHLRGGRSDRCGDARRRDDRRGLAQDGAGHLRQGPRRRHGAHRRLESASDEPEGATHGPPV